MRQSKDGSKSQQQGFHTSPIRPGFTSPTTSSFVSTLSHALNISTPGSSRKHTHSSTSQTTPVARSEQATPTRSQVVRTPTSTSHQLQMLTLSGHEAFHSPNTPVSLCSEDANSSISQQQGSFDSNMVHGQDRGIGELRRVQAQDQEWLMSGPVVERQLNIFGKSSITEQASPFQAGSFAAVKQHSDRHDTSGTFRNNLELAGQPHLTFSGSRSKEAVQASSSAIGPSSGTVWSPVYPSHEFLSREAIGHPYVDPDTPSLSTHLLPNNVLTEYMLPHSTSMRAAAPVHHLQQARQTDTSHSTHLDHSSVPSRSTFTFNMRSQNSADVLTISPCALTASERSSSAAFSQPSSGSTTGHRGASPNVGDPLIGREQAMAGVHAEDEEHFRGRYRQEPLDKNPSEGHGSSGLSFRLGLGLDLSLYSTPSGSGKQAEDVGSVCSILQMPRVDEMGRWMPAQSSQPGFPSHDSTSERGRWHLRDIANASLGATTDGSHMSFDISSTWDTSYAEMIGTVHGPASTSVDSQYVATPDSSVEFSHVRPNVPSEHPKDRSLGACELPSPVATPEIAIPDLSEFGQAVSIEQMADPRWRTWPRNRESVIQRDLASALGLATSPRATPQIQAEGRPSTDSLSASISSGRSRLLAEPYNKNMRSGRPGSDASTSSRSSVGNTSVFESQPSSGTAGPTRVRSLIASGLLRISSTARRGSNAGLDGSQTITERVAGSALALRRARGLSLGGVPGNAAGTSMQHTRSSDAIVSGGTTASAAAKFRNSVALTRTAVSSDGAMRMRQRPQSMLDTVSYRDSMQKTGQEDHRSRDGVPVESALSALHKLLLYVSEGKQDSGQASEETEQAMSSASRNEPISSVTPSRPLRRTRGHLPPRGSLIPVSEFGTLQTSASSPQMPSASNPSRTAPAHTRSQSLNNALRTLEGTQHEDTLAVLGDLSQQLMRLKAEERQKEQHAAASMPPPAARPTRREMQAEFLKKRANGI